MENNKGKKPFYKRWWFWVLAVLLLIIVIAAASGGGDQNPATTGGTASPSISPSIPPAASPSPTTGARSVDMQFTSGNYTAGTDFPAGAYDITAVSGGGNVSSSNLYSGGLNALMGTEEANKATGTDIYQQQYLNIKLPDGVVLSVSGGVTIRITAENASELPLKPRVQPNNQTVELGNGNFVAGQDFPAGTYDIVAVSGGGNVSSDNMYSGGLNAVMGPKGANTGAGIALYEPEYKNIELPQGTTLTVDGVKIKLIPSK